MPVTGEEATVVGSAAGLHPEDMVRKSRAYATCTCTKGAAAQHMHGRTVKAVRLLTPTQSLMHQSPMV